jgi:hypothetical protein
MKKWVIFIVISVIISGFLTGCSYNKGVEFKEIYSQVIGFNESDARFSPIIKQDTILLMTNEDFKNFNEKYFTSRQISMASPNKEKAVLYLQIMPYEPGSVYTYSVKNMNVKDNTLTVNLTKPSLVKVKGDIGLNGTWKWVMLIEVDKAQLKNNMKIVVKK